MESLTPNSPAADERGYSMVELLVVVGLIVVMAAVAVPNIGSYIRNYRIRGATQQLAGEIQRARNKAISKNTNLGVAFRVFDADTYRIYSVDDAQPPAGSEAAARGALHALPQGVVFAAGAGTQVNGMGFDRLGRVCVIGSFGCTSTAAVTAAIICTEPECGNRNPAETYVGLTNGTFTVTVREEATQQLRSITIAPGGRVLSDR